jgi:hypothetical protein
MNKPVIRNKLSRVTVDPEDETALLLDGDKVAEPPAVTVDDGGNCTLCVDVGVDTADVEVIFNGIVVELSMLKG